jgi:nucleotide-binding universal stress UspA family protein
MRPIRHPAAVPCARPAGDATLWQDLIEDEGDAVADSEQGAGIRPVVVGVDATRSAQDAATWAAEVADARGAPLRLVLVGPGTTAPDWLTALATTLRAQTDLVPGPGDPEAVAEALQARAGGAGLLVVGSHGKGSSAGLLAGTAALRLAGTSPCPVAVVRGPTPDRTPPTTGPIVVGIDGTEAGDDALALATDLARDLRAPLHVVHAWSDVVAGPGGGAHRRPEDWSELAAQGEAVAAEARRRVAARAKAIEVEARSVEGTALRTLLDLSESARVVVAAPRSAARAPRPDDGVLLGSTSRGLVGFAPCPVVLAPVRVPADTR